MTKKEIAHNLNAAKGAEHKNCCQAVFAAFAPDYGISTETAFAMASCFGGGLQRGEVCGAVVGALMAIGLKCGENAKARAAEFMNDFSNTYGSLLCRDLKGGKVPCVELVEYAAEKTDMIE